MNKALIVIGLGFGDESKGATTDALARRHDAKLIIRFNGGPQTAHNVVCSDGRHHTFAQFGSASFIPGVRTHLSRFTLINPMNMLREEAHLREVGVTDAFDRLTVDEGCVVITPFQRSLNRLVEWSRGSKAHGSCGQGVGQARSDQIECGDKVLYAGDLRDEATVKAKLKFVQKRMQDKALELGDFHYGKEAAHVFADIFDDNVIDWCWREYSKVPLKIVSSDYLKLLVERNRNVIFEGAQGVLLDEKYGTAPHNTWTDCTCRNADTLLKEIGFDGTVQRIGVLRTYFTRHGAGPFETEDWRLTALLPELHNDNNGFQGTFRRGHFDAVQARYAVNVSGGVNEIALTHLDAFDRLKLAQIRVAGSRVLGHEYVSCASPLEFVQHVELLLRVPVTILSSGPTAEHRTERVPEVSEAA
jgi:adenylosuccinate synthase